MKLKSFRLKHCSLFKFKMSTLCTLSNHTYLNSIQTNVKKFFRHQCLLYIFRKECEAQVKGYNKAKYKKFDSLTEAEDYLKQHSVGVSTNTRTSVMQHPECYSVSKTSPASLSLNVLNVNFHQLEERLNTFVNSTRNTLSDIQKRLDKVESQFRVTNNLTSNCVVNDIKVECNKRKLEDEDQVNNKAIKVESNHYSMRDSDIDINAVLESVNSIEAALYSEQFIKSEDGFVVVYTDGACSKNGKLGAKAGIGVWFSENHPLNVSGPVRGYATNNNAEIQAAAKAVLQATKAGIKKLEIRTDSQFMIKCMTTWIHRWKKNDWKLKDGGDVKNKEELCYLDNAIQNLDCLKWTYVKGHSGDRGNSEADALARKGAEMYDCSIVYVSK